jgi:hypothetical protein
LNELSLPKTKIKMKNILLILLVIFGTSCTQRLRIEREPNVPIEQYNTYSWNTLNATNAVHPFYKSYELNLAIIKEIDRQFAQIGLVRNAVNPDFLVDYHIYVEEQKYQNEVCPTGFYRGGRYLPEITNNINCENPQIVSYDDGTLIIDIVDAHTNQLVWRASLSDLIDKPINANSVFRKEVKRILRKFPTKTKNNSIKNQEISLEKDKNISQR